MSRRTITIALAVLAVVVAAAVVFGLVAEGDDAAPSEPTVIDGVESRSTDTEHPPQRDIDPGLDCRVEIGRLLAGGQVTNRSEDPSTYTLIVAWENGGTRVADATTVIDAVAPGASATWNVTGIGSGNIDTTCRVVRIDLSPT